MEWILLKSSKIPREKEGLPSLSGSVRTTDTIKWMCLHSHTLGVLPESKNAKNKHVSMISELASDACLKDVDSLLHWAREQKSVSRKKSTEPYSVKEKHNLKAYNRVACYWIPLFISFLSAIMLLFQFITFFSVTL